jgi:hypothetical protein
MLVSPEFLNLPISQMHSTVKTAPLSAEDGDIDYHTAKLSRSTMHRVIESSISLNEPCRMEPFLPFARPLSMAQIFWDLAGSRIRHCNGHTFFLKKSKAIKIKVSSRVAVDAAFFHEMQPNYSRTSLRDMEAKEKDGIAFIDVGAMFMEDREGRKGENAR